MAYTAEDLANLQAAIAKGARVVQMDGERVEFRSLDEMLRIERKIIDELGTGSRASRRMIYPVTGTGWR